MIKASAVGLVPLHEKVHVFGDGGVVRYLQRDGVGRSVSALCQVVRHSDLTLASQFRAGTEQGLGASIRDVVGAQNAVLHGLHVKADDFRRYRSGSVEDVHELDVSVTGQRFSADVALHPRRPMIKRGGVARKGVPLKHAEVGIGRLHDVVRHNGL